jgi:hypothetical protein
MGGAWGRNTCRVLVRKPEGFRPLGGPRRICADNIKMYLRETGRDGFIWLRIGVNGGLL